VGWGAYKNLLTSIVTFHRAIYAAIEKQDGAAASKTMADHLEELWHDAATYAASPGDH